MCDIKQLRKQLFSLRREQVKHFFGTPAWIRLEAEMNAVNDQINDLPNK